jgi:uncharacterized coiled-coil DUF342 family protein
MKDKHIDRISEMIQNMHYYSEEMNRAFSPADTRQQADGDFEMLIITSCKVNVHHTKPTSANL